MLNISIHEHKAKVIKKGSEYCTVLCRFGHVFTIGNGSDLWCKTCQSQDFQSSLISEINSDLCEKDNPLIMISITQYGVATVICPYYHIDDCDVDEIPKNCSICDSITPDNSENVKGAASCEDGTSEDIDDINYLSGYETNSYNESEIQYDTDDVYDEYNGLSSGGYTDDSEDDFINTFNEFKDFDIESYNLDKSIYMTKVRMHNYRPNNIDFNLDILTIQFDNYEFVTGYLDTESEVVESNESLDYSEEIKKDD
jgi:hypothetical protein